MPSLPAALAHLGLAPHPEGGWFRETHRSAHCTVIDFVLLPGEVSAWHRVSHGEEVWMHHRGGSLTLHQWRPGEAPSHTELGPDCATSVVPQGTWQAAEPTGKAWVWVSCVVAPPFAFEHFELASASLEVPPPLVHLLPGADRG